MQVALHSLLHFAVSQSATQFMLLTPLDVAAIEHARQHVDQELRDVQGGLPEHYVSYP